MNRRDRDRAALKAVRGHFDPRRRTYTLDEASSRAWHDNGAQTVAINRLASDIADMYGVAVAIVSADGTVLRTVHATEEAAS